MAPSRVAGGLTHSSPSSGIFFQGDGQSQALGNSPLSSSFGNSSNSVPVAGRSNLGPVSGDASNTVLNSIPSSGPSVGASSMVTDANSGLSGGPHLQRSPSINAESYMRLPASPLSFSSNNLSISGSSVIDGSSNQDRSSQQVPQNQQQQGTSSATSLPTSRMGQVSLPNGTRIPGSFGQDPNNITHPQLQALIQQQRRQQQQFLQSISPVQRAHLLQQQQQLQLRQQLQQQNMQPISSIKRPIDNGVCSRRLMQYQIGANILRRN